jgi:phosphoglycolate phosphatase-like HAD superfamily hydrolase
MNEAKLKVILDFDGTLTAEEEQVEELSRRSLETLAGEILHVAPERLREEYRNVRSRLLGDPRSFCWRVNGLCAAYCDEGAFILNTTVLQTLLREGEEYLQAVQKAFPDPEYEPVSDCVNHLFHRHTAEIPPRFRPGAAELLERLEADPGTEPVVLTNSLGDKVRSHLETVGLGRVRILGDTRQYAMDPGWEPDFDRRGGDGAPVWALPTGHRVDLRRPAYRDALDREQQDGARLLVVADTFSLPGAVPLRMGIPFTLLLTPYTPDWCRQAVEHHPLGTTVESLEQVAREGKAASSPAREAPPRGIPAGGEGG